MHNNETLFYIKQALHRLDKIKIVFENHYPINAKLFRPTFNYPKFYNMTDFVKCIQDWESIITYDTGYNKIAHKYFYKAFINRPIRKNKSHRF